VLLVDCVCTHIIFLNSRSRWISTHTSQQQKSCNQPVKQKQVYQSTRQRIPLRTLTDLWTWFLVDVRRDLRVQEPNSLEIKLLFNVWIPYAISKWDVVDHYKWQWQPHFHSKISGHRHSAKPCLHHLLIEGQPSVWTDELLLVTGVSIGDRFSAICLNLST